MNSYYLIFYRLYKNFTRMGGDLPVYKSILVFSFINSMNLFACFLLADIFTSNNILQSIPKQNLFIVCGLIYVFCIVINSVVLYSKGRYKEIINEFEEREASTKTKVGRYWLVYIFGSIILIFILAPINL